MPAWSVALFSSIMGCPRFTSAHWQCIAFLPSETTSSACLLAVLWAESLPQHSLLSKLPRLPQIPPLVSSTPCILSVVCRCRLVWPAAGRMAAGSNGSPRGGGPCWKDSAGSTLQAALLGSHSLGTYSPVWLTLTRAKNQPNRWAWWQATKALWMHIVWVRGPKLPVRDIQRAARHSPVTTAPSYAPNRQVLMSFIVAVFGVRRSTVKWCQSWQCSWGIWAGLQQKGAQRKSGCSYSCH